MIMAVTRPTWTEEQKNLSRINYAKAKKHFNVQKGECLHHIDPSWLYEDVDRYVQWNFEDLVKMTKSEHLRMHNKGNKNAVGNKTSEEGRKRKAHFGETNGMWGKTHTEEVRKRLSESSKKLKNNLGRHWYNNGVIQVMAFECPEGFVLGSLNHQPKSEEAKRKMSDARKGKEPWNKGLKYKIVDGKSVLV